MLMSSKWLRPWTVDPVTGGSSPLMGALSKSRAGCANEADNFMVIGSTPMAWTQEGQLLAKRAVSKTVSRYIRLGGSNPSSSARMWQIQKVF